MSLFDPLHVHDQKIISELRINNYIHVLNKLYEKTQQYLDQSFVTEIKSRSTDTFHQRWVEMLTLYKLLNEKITPRLPNKGKGQPDIRIDTDDNKQIWIECTSPTPGKYKNQLEIRCAQAVPIEHLRVRVTTVVEAKIKQYRKHMKSVTNISVIPILLINVGLLNYELIDEYAGLFKGWQDIRFYFDQNSNNIQGQSIPCKKIHKPDPMNSSKQIPIEIDYFNQQDFPFWIVIISSDKLGSWSSAPDNGVLFNPHFINNENLPDSIENVLNAILVDYTKLLIS